MYLITIVVLIIGSSSGCVAASSDKPATPQDRIDLGAFLSLDLYYNQTKLTNKLRLSKSYIKGVINGGIGEKVPLINVKVTHVEELVPCENLTLRHQELADSIDCKSAQAHLTKDSSSAGKVGKPATDNYSKRSSIHMRVDARQPFQIKDKAELLLYPLKKNVVEKKIESCSSRHNLGELDPLKLRQDLGYYFQYTFSKNSLFQVQCSGELLVSVNKSTPIDFSGEYPTTDWMFEFHSILEHAIENSYLFSLENVICEKQNFDLVGMNVGFTIAQRQQFPYLTVKHTIVSSPLEQIFNYEGTVQQKRDSQNLDTYNTTISLKSRSMFAEFVNFNLEQEFVNLEKNSGFENMKLLHPKLAVLVDALWKEDGLVKNVNLYLQKNKDWLNESINHLTKAMQFQLTNSGDSDYVTLTWKILRTLIPSLEDLLSLIDSEDNYDPLQNDLDILKELHDEL